MPRVACFALVLAGFAAAPAPARAAGPDWNAVAAVEEVKVLTANEDGSRRETTIWLVVVDGQGYVRGGSGGTWGQNAQRNPEVALRIEGTEYPLRATPVSDAALRERIEKTFREKYGWFDGFVNVFRGSEPLILRLDSR
jgi:hypothetical protein